MGLIYDNANGFGDVKNISFYVWLKSLWRHEKYAVAQVGLGPFYLILATC